MNIDYVRKRWQRLVKKPERDTDLPESTEVTAIGKDPQDSHEYHSEMVRRPNTGIAGTGTGPTFTAKTANALTPNQIKTQVKALNAEVAKPAGQRTAEGLQGMARQFKVAPLFSGAHKALMSTLSMDPRVAGTLYGLGAGAATIGALGGLRWLRGEPFRWNSPRKLLAGAGVGLLGGLAAGHASSDWRRRQGIAKEAFFSGSIVQDNISRKLMQDASLTVAQRAEIMRGVSQLPVAQQTNLLQLLSAVTGAGIGAAVSRFLMRAGVLGTMLGTVGGALIGSRLGRGPDPRGERHGGFWINNQVDIFGNIR